MSEFQLLIDKEDRDIQISVQPESAKIMSYYDKLSRIILNLVSNAFKYSEAGTKLSIDAVVENHRLKISVTDEGQGIQPNELENIFIRSCIAWSLHAI